MCLNMGMAGNSKQNAFQFQSHRRENLTTIILFFKEKQPLVYLWLVFLPQWLPLVLKSPNSLPEDFQEDFLDIPIERSSPAALTIKKGCDD